MKAGNFIGQKTKERYESVMGKRNYETAVREAEKSDLPFEKAFGKEIQNYIMAVIL